MQVTRRLAPRQPIRDYNPCAVEACRQGKPQGCPKLLWLFPCPAPHEAARFTGWPPRHVPWVKLATQRRAGQWPSMPFPIVGNPVQRSEIHSPPLRSLPRSRLRSTLTTRPLQPFADPLDPAPLLAGDTWTDRVRAFTPALKSRLTPAFSPSAPRPSDGREACQPDTGGSFRLTPEDPPCDR